MGVKTALYRHFDAAGALLYVGISNDALRRLCQHKDRSHWHAQIVRVDVEWFSDRAAALKAEAEAIGSENPAWNVRGIGKRRAPQKANPAPAFDPASPLVGMFFHTFTDAGARQYQAHVLAVDGDVAVAQMFSWLFGEPTHVQTFTKAFLYSDRCRLYRDIESWRDAGAHDERIGAAG